MSRADIKAAGSEWKSGSTLKLHWYDRLTTLSVLTSSELGAAMHAAANGGKPREVQV